MMLWLVLAAVSALLVGDYLRFAHHRLALRPMLHAPPQGQLGDVVRLSGWVDEIPAPLAAPFTGTACAAFCASALLEYPKPGAAPRQSHPLEQQMTTFTLRTAQGPVRVRAERIDVALPMRRLLWASPERRRAFAERWRLAEDNVPRVLRPQERAVVLGERISVVGRLASSHGEPSHTPYRDPASELWLIEAGELGLIIGPVDRLAPPPA